MPLMSFQASHAERLWYKAIAPSPSNGLDKLPTADVMEVRALGAELICSSRSR